MSKPTWQYNLEDWQRVLDNITVLLPSYIRCCEESPLDMCYAMQLAHLIGDQREAERKIALHLRFDK